MESFLEGVPDEALKYARHGIASLTVREREVLRLVANANSSKQAAAQLGLSPRTVEIYRSRVLNKLGAKSSIDLVRILACLSRMHDDAA